MSTQRMVIRSPRYALITLLSAVFLGLCPIGPSLFQATPVQAASLDTAREKLGLALIAGLHRLLHVANDLGRNFEGKISSWDFVDGHRRLRIRIEGFAVLEGRWIRHRVMQFLSVETPLPRRPECEGFFQVMIPEWAAKVPDRDPVPLPYRLDMQVDLDEAMKVAGMAAFNRLIEDLSIFSSADYQKVFAAVPNKRLQEILGKLFPGFLKYLTTRTVDTAFDQVLEHGGANGTALLAGFNLDELIGFGLNFGLGLVSTAAGGAAAGAAASAVGAAAITVPVIGEVAVGTVLVIVAAKTATTLVAWSKRAVQDTIFLDRFSKIDWYLLDRYPSGERDYNWFINQVNKESASEKYETLSQFMLFLRFRNLEIRRRWSPVMLQKIGPILESRAVHHQSWSAPKYRGMIDILFSGLVKYPGR